MEVFWNTPEELKNGINKGVYITGNFVDLKLSERENLYASYDNLETTKGISRDVVDIVNKQKHIQVSDTKGNTYEFVETTSVGRDIWKKVDKLAPYPDFDFNYIFDKYKTKSNALVTHKYSKKLLLLITQEEVDKLLKPYGLGPMDKELKAESQRVNDFRYASVEVDRVKDTELDMTIEIQTTVNKYTINVSYNKNFGENLVIDRLEEVKRG